MSESSRAVRVEIDREDDGRQLAATMVELTGAGQLLRCKLALRGMCLLCRAFWDNAERLQLFAFAYNLAHFLRSPALPNEAAQGSLITLRKKLVRIGARSMCHGRNIVFPLAQVAVPRAMFAALLHQIAGLRGRPVVAAGPERIMGRPELNGGPCAELTSNTRAACIYVGWALMTSCTASRRQMRVMID